MDNCVFHLPFPHTFFLGKRVIIAPDLILTKCKKIELDITDNQTTTDAGIMDASVYVQNIYLKKILFNFMEHD
ncbi:hypothetical protein J4229_03990 [Candidatus Pacearchaeota archaeon]|nr:hypothetical protein [Candidatus Pacearchaeota archaeon]